MSSHTPTFEAPRRDGTYSTVSSEVHQAHLLATSAAFELRRSPLVSWTVRVAQVADRIIARTFPTTFLSGDTSDGLVEKTLNGLDRCFRLIPTHQGVVAVERARLSVRQLLSTRHKRYWRFQRLRQDMSQERFSHTASYLRLNPICRWIRMTDELERHESPSGSVLFFLTENDVHGLRMSLEGQVLINELADYQPCTVAQWAELSILADAWQIDVLVKHLAEIGLVAWGSE